jgi:hypothetical protein
MRIAQSIVTRASVHTRRGHPEPEPAPRPSPEPEAGRVVVDVRDHPVEVALVRDHTRLEAVLEEVAVADVAAVEAHGVEAVQPLHPPRELRLRRLDQDVEVVVEQVPDVDLPAVARRDLDEQLVPRLPIEVVQHDPPLLDAAADDVVPGGAGEEPARNPRHEPTVPPRARRRKCPNRPFPYTS